MPSSTTLPLRLVPNAEAAELLGVRPQTLRKWRCLGGGPPYIRLGRGLGARVAYRPADLNEWLLMHTFASTSEEGAGSKR